MSGWLAIVNAFAGGHARASRTVANALEKLRPLIRATAFSEYRGHARRLAAAAGDYSGVVAVGGDGTLLEVLNGIDRSRQTIAILPTGRGNSLARDLGLHPLSSAIDALRYGEHATIDVAEVVLLGGSGQHTRVTSASTVAIGYPVATTVLANRMRRLGRFCYAATALAATIRLKPIAIEVAYDGGDPSAKRLTGLIINNTRHVANFLAFPEADCADGCLDVMEMKAGFTGQTLHNLSALSRLRFYEHAPIRPAHTVALKLPRSGAVMIDGEIYRDIIAVNLRVLARSLECIRATRVHRCSPVFSL